VSARRSESGPKGNAELAAIADLQHEIDIRLRCGEPFPQVEHDVIEPSDLAEDDKSALWLYGWASLETGRFATQRHREPLLR
jgi:hypothetical protein